MELPENVYSAGPVPLAVQTDHTSSVSVTLDGVDAGELIAAGGGLFTGELPVRGAIDNGSHEIEVIATQGKYEDRRPYARPPRAGGILGCFGIMVLKHGLHDPLEKPAGRPFAEAAMTCRARTELRGKCFPPAPRARASGTCAPPRR